MDNENENGVTIISIDKMIYHAIDAMRYNSLSKRPDEQTIFSFVKELLGSNEIEESVFLKKLKILQIAGEVITY